MNIFALILTILLSQMILLEANAETIMLTRWDRLSTEKQDSLSKIRKATFAFDMGRKLCSGTFISNTGHIITARHCLDDCADASTTINMLWHTKGPDGQMTNFTQAQFADHLARGGSNQFFSSMIADRSLKGTTCEARINGKLVKLVYLGGGRGPLWPFSPDKLPSKDLEPGWLQFVSQGYGPGGDFAVFKADISSTPCLPLSKTSVKLGEQLRVLSATMEIGYSSKEERLGQTAFFSEGPESSARRGAERSDLPLRVFRHGEFQCESGSSGSSVIGEDDTIKGILVQGMDKGEFGVRTDTYSSFIDVLFIRKSLATNWDTEIPECH